MDFRERLIEWLKVNIEACQSMLEQYDKHPPITDSSVANAWFTQCAFVELLGRIERGEFGAVEKPSDNPLDIVV
jgi:hypothetical protein